MKRCQAIALFFVLIPVLGLAQQKAKKHNDVPAAFQNAHSVYVEAADGDYSRPGLSEGDRQAIADVQDALHTWNRYVLAVHREQADLVFVVRKARGGRADTQSGLPAAPRPAGAPSPVRAPGQPGDIDSMGATADAGAEDDSLRVYTVNAGGKLKGPIWSREQRNGLDAPGVLILRQLKLAVESAYPSPLPTDKPTP